METSKEAQVQVQVNAILAISRQFLVLVLFGLSCCFSKPNPFVAAACVESTGENKIADGYFSTTAVHIHRSIHEEISVKGFQAQIHDYARHLSGYTDLHTLIQNITRASPETFAQEGLAMVARIYPGLENPN